jgi:hypothetical protein
MRISEQITKRFGELLQQGEKILSTRRNGSSVSGGVAVIMPDFVDDSLAQEWATSCLSFLGRVMGKDSDHYRRFAENVEQVHTHSYAVRACAVLRAAKADYDGGYLFDARKQIQAEVFDEFLEQAEYFLKDGYFQVAAVVAGAVLEDGLRKLCSHKGITLPSQPKLDWMNGELAKSGLYDKMVQKKVTWLADIRNKAAHGRWSEFTADDASEMTSGVRRLMTDYVSS